MITGKVVTDLFPDPNDPTLVLAVVVNAGGSYVVASHDGGKTFVDPAIYETPSGLITGLELAKSQPGVVYATSVTFSGGASTLARSDDFGAHWTPWPIAVPGGSEPLIMAIDPEDANRSTSAWSERLTDSVVITQNGGQSFETPLTITGQFSSFLRATDGTLYLGSVAGKLYVRAPGTADFTNHAAPHFRCLGQRPGTTRIFACGDMGIDGFSVGYSDNGGQTFQGMMSFTDLLGPLTCPSVASNCAAHWQRIQGVLGIAPPPDSGTGTPDAGSPDAGTPPPPNPGGQKSGCSTTDGNPVLILGLIVVLVLLLRVRP